MPECRSCGVALDWHEHELCRECWYATEADAGSDAAPWVDEDG